MILALLATLALQKADPPDPATAVLAVSDQCLAVMLGEAEPPPAARRLVLADGRAATVILGRHGCEMTIEDWSDDAGALTTTVRDGLVPRPHWTISQWRERQVNESGPALWTSLVFPDIRRHSAYWVQIIEPERGAPQRLSVSFGIGP